MIVKPTKKRYPDGGTVVRYDVKTESSSLVLLADKDGVMIQQHIGRFKPKEMHELCKELCVVLRMAAEDSVRLREGQSLPDVLNGE